MSCPYCRLVEEITALVPPLDQCGFHETLAQIDARLLDISDRPSKHSMRTALHSLCRARANIRFAELGLVARF